MKLGTPIGLMGSLKLTWGPGSLTSYPGSPILGVPNLTSAYYIYTPPIGSNCPVISRTALDLLASSPCPTQFFNDAC